MTPEGAVAPANASARTASWPSSSEHFFSVTYRYHIDAAYCDVYGGTLPVHPRMDAPLPEDISEDRPHIAFTPYLQQLTARVIDGLEDPLDRARAIYDYLTQHIDYRYQPPYLLLGSIADDCAHSLRGDCGVMALTFITMCRIAGVPARWQSGLFVTPDDTGYFSILINNGRIIDKNLKRMGRDERWLQKQLQKRGAQSVQDVYLLMLNDAGQIYFSAKEPI